jgi:hypothetical protein
MSWMFRWLERLVARLRVSDSTDAKWIEPSNAITRAILSGALLQPALPAPAKVAAAASPAATLQQPEVAATVAEPEVVETPDRAAATVTRTAQRSRRRRAGRAA